MKRFFLLMIISLVTFTFAVSEPAIVSQIKKNYSTSTTIKTQFTLTTFWKTREKTDTKQGLFYLAPGDKFKVKLGLDTYASDGKTFVQYNEKSKQMVIKNASQIDPSISPSRVFSTFLTYKFIQTGSNSTTATLSWTAPADSTSFFTRITLTAAKKGGTLQKLKMEDKNGNIQTYVFTGTVVGKPIPKETFTFEKPKGASVIDMR